LSLDEAKGQIEADLKRQKVTQKFAGAADQFQNLVYEQADSLAGVAKALGLQAKTTDWATRADAQKLAFGNAKFVQALFAPESVSAKRNTEAIEVGPNSLMAGRIVEYKPAAPRPFDDVKDEIRRQLVAREATALADKEGRAKLALLEQGKSDKEAGVTFGKPVSVLRNQMQPGFTPDALTRVFRVDAAKLPQYVGATNERGGYSIYRVQKTMMPPTATDPSKLVAARSRIGELQSRELFDAYVSALKAKADLRINQANLEKVAARAAHGAPGAKAPKERAIASRRMRPAPPATIPTTESEAAARTFACENGGPGPPFFFPAAARRSSGATLADLLVEPIARLAPRDVVDQDLLAFFVDAADGLIRLVQAQPRPGVGAVLLQLELLGARLGGLLLVVGALRLLLLQIGFLIGEITAAGLAAGAGAPTTSALMFPGGAGRSR
jgi:hypothetical protein